MVLDHALSTLRSSKDKEGLGFTKVPLPYNNNYIKKPLEQFKEDHLYSYHKPAADQKLNIASDTTNLPNFTIPDHMKLNNFAETIHQKLSNFASPAAHNKLQTKSNTFTLIKFVKGSTMDDEEGSLSEESNVEFIKCKK